MVMKGPGQVSIPSEKGWKNYNRHMHSVLARIEELNPYLTVLGDRIFTEAALTDDTELLRRYKCYKNAAIIYICADVNDLMSRGTKEEKCWDSESDYQKLLDIFENTKVSTSEKTVTEAVNEVMSFVKDFRKKSIEEYENEDKDEW